MDIRRTSTVQSLEDDLDLFNEADWNFIDIPTDYSNAEYFNDVRDTQFDKTTGKEDLKQFAIMTGYVFVLVVVLMIAISKLTMFNNEDYDRVSNIKSVADTSSQGIERVEGNTVDDSDLASISTTLSEYFCVLSQSSGYNSLYKYCLTTSAFADTYNSRVNAIQTSYDTNDCYARMLKLFGSYCNNGKINDVVEKDGIYYVYVNLALPTDTDTTTWVYSQSYNLTKHFNSNAVTEENLLKYLLDSMSMNKYNCSTNEYCLEFTKDDNGNLLLTDDTVISDACIQAYSDLIEETKQTVGGDIQNIQY